MEFNSEVDIADLPRHLAVTELLHYEDRFVAFKLANQVSYRRYRETVQLLDAAVLHPASLEFEPRVLAAGLLYLMTSKYFYDSSYALLHHTGGCAAFGAAYAAQWESAQAVQDLYLEFAAVAADIEHSSDLYAVAGFLHEFLDLEVPLELPIVCRVQSKSQLERHYEEFLAYQTHSTVTLEFVTRRLRRGN